MVLRRISFHLAFGTFLTTFGTVMLYGYNIAVFNLPEQKVKAYLTSKSVNATEQQQTLFYSISTSVFIVGGTIGAFTSRYVADKIGRRRGLICNNMVTLLASCVFFISLATRVPELIYVARLLIGFSCGAGIVLASTFLNEIAPVRIRGEITACCQVAVVLGTILANLLTFEQVLGQQSLWIVASGLSAVPALVQALCHWSLPESPRYLFQKGKYDEAKAANKKYDPERDEEDFMNEMESESSAKQAEQEFHFWQIFKPTYSKPMLVACLIPMFAMFSGINAVTAYSKLMMSTAGVPPHTVQYCVVGVSAFGLLTVLISLPLLDRVGRRPVLLITTIILGLCLVGLGISVELRAHFENTAQEEAAKHASIAALVFIYLHVGSFNASLGSISMTIVPELFRQGPRGPAVAVSQMMMWLSNLIVIITYPNVERKIGGIVFFIFFSIVTPIWILFYVIFPETKARTVEEVTLSMERPVRCCGKSCWPRKEEESHSEDTTVSGLP